MVTDFLDPIDIDALPDDEKLGMEFLARVNATGLEDGKNIVQHLRRESYSPDTPIDFRDEPASTLEEMDLSGLPMRGKAFASKHIPVLLQKYKEGEISFDRMDLRAMHFSEEVTLIEGVTFNYCNFGKGDIFDEVTLKDCHFNHCGISKVNFESATLENTEISERTSTKRKAPEPSGKFTEREIEREHKRARTDKGPALDH